uniref:Uncharacterized protein n=1 Tax=Paramoeba aestuarina TaxID=180227 RepID=A0A7S4L0M7_9EUKA|mmetsp:Transcript_29137/g.45072  ORF Transcript_29137/g.45072 Transcript_29137/m.45072 type:complete len:207 (+) Transcript_29137:337-957(+)
MRAGTSYKTPGMEITENEEVKDWLFSSAAQAISQQNRELLQEREKTSKHFSHAFGECTFPTSETEVSKLFLPAVYAQKFHSSGTAIRPMKETGISNYQNVNRTWFQEPEGWSLFYFLKECGTHGANLALNGLNAKQTPSEVGTVRQSFDTILNTALIPTQMNIEGGQALLLPSNVIQRLSLQIVSPCKFIVFHFQMEKQNYQCHLI